LLWYKRLLETIMPAGSSRTSSGFKPLGDSASVYCYGPTVKRLFSQNTKKHKMNTICALAWNNTRHSLSQFHCPLLLLHDVNHSPMISFLQSCKPLAFYLLINHINHWTFLSPTIFFHRVWIKVPVCATISGHSMWWWFYIAKRQTLQSYYICQCLFSASKISFTLAQHRQSL
jgi:hypothetical protein